MTAPLVLPLLAIAAVLLVSGAAKVSDRVATADMFVALRIPVLPPALGARVLPSAEIALGLALLVARGPVLVVVTILAVAVFAAYCSVIARAMTFDPPVSCSCFGKLGGNRVDGATLARNTLLVALAVLAVVAALRDVNVVQGLSEYADADWTWLALVLVVSVVVWLVAHGGRAGDDAAVPMDSEEVDYVRAPIPYGFVEDASGSRQTLRELGHTKARLLVLLNPGCGPCDRIGQQLGDWSRQLGDAVAVHAVYATQLDGLPPLPHPVELALFEPERNVSRVLGSSAPAAVLLGADGLVAGGPVAGQVQIEGMVEEIVDQLTPDEAR